MRKETYMRMFRNPRTYNCRSCSAEFNGFPLGRHWYCKPCSLLSHKAQLEAKGWVSRAIRNGVLMRADQFRCVDCGDWATGWEHRDYSQPLQVEPTCSSCNFKRGPAAFALGVA